MDNSELERLSSHFEALLDILQDERNALTEHDGDALTACVAKKEALCASVNEIVQASPELLAAMHASNNHDASETKSDPGHKTLLELATAARDSNLVNGKILHRSQQSVREILGILSGKSLDGLYEQSGQQSAVHEGGSNAIARA